MDKELWAILEKLKSDNYDWVDLSYDVSPKTHHWEGYNDLEMYEFLTRRSRLYRPLLFNYTKINISKTYRQPAQEKQNIPYGLPKFYSLLMCNLEHALNISTI